MSSRFGFRAVITRRHGPPVVLGPVERKGEAARLAEAWMTSHPHPQSASPQHGEAGSECVEGVLIERVGEGA